MSVCATPASGWIPASEADGYETRSHNWPEPLKAEAFYGLAGQVVRVIEPHTESDPAALLIQFLVAFGNLIGRRAHFVAEAAQHFTNLFAVIVGQTSKGRKGSSLGQVRYFLQSLDSKWNLERIIPGGLSTGEGLIWAVRDAIYQNVPTKEKGQITGCQEVMTDSGVEDKRLLVTEPEFARLLQVSGRKENTLSAVLRQCWDSGDLQTLTRSQSARSTHAHISLIGHITKDELRRTLTDTSMCNGFANRFLWVCARRSKLLPEGGALHKLDLAPLIRKLNEAATFSRTTGLMERDDAGRELWPKIYRDLNEERSGLFGAIISRAEPLVMRLGCVYALLDCSARVRPEHLHAALAVWRYCEASARFIFGDAIGDETADEILRVLRATPKGVTRTDLRDHFQRNKPAAEINRALGVLQEQGLARMEKCPTEGAIRPTEVWFSI